MVVKILLNELGQAQLVEVDGLLLDIADGSELILEGMSPAIDLVDFNVIVAPIRMRLLSVHVILSILEYPIKVFELFSRRFWHLEALFYVNSACIDCMGRWRRLLPLLVQVLALV